MPLYIDIHKQANSAADEAAADAHRRDLETQANYGVKYLKYWFDASTGYVFYLVEAPSKDAAVRVHREAHGLVADEIYEVVERT